MTIEECRRWLEAFECKHGITYVECLRGEARSNHRTRTSYAPATTNYQAVAVRTHEDSHIIAGACPQTPPHLRDLNERRWWNCLACENIAWDLAVRSLPFNREMFSELQRCLGTYRRATIATQDARIAAQRIASDHTYATTVQARAEREYRLEMHRQMTEALDWELHRMTPRMRRLQQIAELEAWAQEAGR